ncbi:hypothetical protein GCM10007036_41310 [Alsobacter metallidurans]|uniref:DUF2937 family protein n=1 Tax=Alsobacter metallidurans TaxID=340221 RepID=A0A917MJQ6_9HYPH|nr:DUF2937 family protein [Alsobacter metallidurans]GGH30604.1 hypothetical protein GCM10007036_41310 [Alsobacter metallidurans]
MLSRTLAFAIGLLGAVAGSQIPEFGQQYRQRLGGAIDELQGALSRFDADARAVQLARPDAIARLQGNPDSLAQARGKDLAFTEQRLAALERQRERMRDAGPFGRVAVLARDSDTLVMRGAFQAFEPAVPVTLEGAVAAGLGFLAAYGVIRLAATPFRRRRWGGKVMLSA